MIEKTLPPRILAIGAHPDDLEILAGGTLAKYARLGCHVSMAIATDGSAGHMLIPADELALIRREEAEASANVIDADFFWMGFRDEYLENNIETRLIFVDLIRKSKPDIILTHNPGDYHPDHRNVSQLVFDASFLSGLPNVKTEFSAHKGVQPLFYFDSFGLMNFTPNEYVDITEVFDVKNEMLSKHVSQVKWLMDHDSLDVLEVIHTFAKIRGMQCGVDLAEGFKSELVWPRMRAFRQLP